MSRLNRDICGAVVTAKQLIRLNAAIAAEHGRGIVDVPFLCFLTFIEDRPLPPMEMVAAIYYRTMALTRLAARGHLRGFCQDIRPGFCLIAEPVFVATTKAKLKLSRRGGATFDVAEFRRLMLEASQEEGRA